MRRFSIGEMVDRTGVAEGTLRMWERRHGFPAPERLTSGHRRYSQADVDAVAVVAAERAKGTPVELAIRRARQLGERPGSLYASIRRSHPELEVQLLSKRALLALTHALEDECLSRAERPLLFGSFQRARFYRQDETRWREFARSAELTCVLADFAELHTPHDGPAEIPTAEHSPLLREWAVVCDAVGYSACLLAWERPSSPRRPTANRPHFESLWSVEPEIVRDAARTCAQLASGQVPELIARAQPRLQAQPSQSTSEQLRLAGAVANRALGYLS